MSKIARLIIFFSINYAIIFLFAIVLGSISFWVDSASILLPDTAPGRDFAEVIWTAISAGIYFSIVLTLSYSVRKKLPVFLSIFSIAALAFAFTSGISLVTYRFEALRPVFTPVSPIHSEPGLMLNRLENTIILLKESSEIHGPRVVSLPGQPLIYQDRPVGPNNSIISLPPLPLGSTAPWFIRSLGIDFSLSAAQLRALFDSNFLSFAAFALCLILFLSSLRFLLELSQWPLANIFFAAFVFRFILSFEIFIDSVEIKTTIGSFLDGRLPPLFITPSAFAALAILTILYTLLSSIARSGSHK